MEIYIDELSKEYPQELDSQFSFQETIASGAFGTVFRAIETSTKREVAIKVINKSGAKIALLQKLKQEVSILKQLKHVNIVEFFGYIETNTKLYIMMELIKCGTLKNWIHTHKGTITEEEASTIINHLLSAVGYLHSRDICHRDIKPENIMLNNHNDLTTLKLIDFGLSQQHFDYLEDSDYCGTMLYMAPEQIEKKTYTKTVDIWAIGVIMFMLLNKGKHPFYNKGDKRRSYVNKIKTTKVKLFNKCSQMASILLYKLLEPNPSWRYTADKAYRHPWITRCLQDEVPETFNETLKKRNIRKRFNELMMISIFLNKATTSSRCINRSMTSKHKTYVINSDYVNKMNKYSKRQRERVVRLREKSFDVISSESSLDSINEPQDKTIDTNRKQSNNNCITVDTSKVKSKASINSNNSNHCKLTLNRNAANRANNLNAAAHYSTTTNTNTNTNSNNNSSTNNKLNFPIIPKTTFKRTSNNQITAMFSINKNIQAKEVKDSYMNNLSSSTKVITVPKIKTNNTQTLIKKIEYNSPMQIMKTEPNQHQHNNLNQPQHLIYSNPVRTNGKSTELRNQGVNKLILSSTSPRKVYKGIIPKKHLSIVRTDIELCSTDENFPIVPLILPNISLNHIQRCRIGNV